MPLKPCAQPGCAKLVDVGQAHCAKHAKQNKKERDKFAHLKRPDRSWRKWYGRKAWRQGRRLQCLEKDPLCVMCPDHSKQPSTIADHIIPHNGDYALFWFGELQGLCKPCHDIEKRRIERRASSQGGHQKSKS